MKLNRVHAGIYFLLLLLCVACNDESIQPEPMEEPVVSIFNLKLTTSDNSVRGIASSTAVGVVAQVNDYLILLLDSDKNILKAYSTDSTIQTLGQEISATRGIHQYIHIIGNIEQNKLRVLNGIYNKTATDLAGYLNDNPGIPLSGIYYQLGEQGIQVSKPEETSQKAKLSHPQCVNVRGELDLNNLAVTQTGWIPNDTTIILEVNPAVARLEIRSVTAVAGKDINSKIQRFRLENIFINNSFQYIGADYQNYPTSWVYPTHSSLNWYKTELIAYNWNADADDYFYPYASFFKAKRDGNIRASAYPVDFCLANIDLGQMAIDNNIERNPSAIPYPVDGEYWSFYILPAWKNHPRYDEALPNDGTNYPYIGNAIWSYEGKELSIASNRRYHRATPMLVIKLSDFREPRPVGYNEEESFGWLTVTDFYDAENYDAENPEISRIHRFLPGKVYRIEELQFSDEQVMPQPVAEYGGNPYALVNIRDWTEADISD